MQDLSPTEIDAIVRSLGSTAHVNPKVAGQTPVSDEIKKNEGQDSPSIAKIQLTQLQEEIQIGKAIKADSLQNIKIEVNVVLGRTRLPLKKLLEMQNGSIIPLDKLAGEPVEIEANGVVIGWGDVVVVDDNFGIRVTKICE
jgi:flagellar motor switch protein FliN/FliY